MGFNLLFLRLICRYVHKILILLLHVCFGEVCVIFSQGKGGGRKSAIWGERVKYDVCVRKVGS